MCIRDRIWELLSGHHPAAEETRESAAADPAAHEKKVVSGAVRTDFILSAEIMVISLNEVASEGFWSRAVILLVVALAITALVYGVVALIVKMDDVGLGLAARDSGPVSALGRGLVRAMPIVLSVLSTVGIAAMLWVGGHILLLGVDELGFAPPYAFVHHLEVLVHDATGPLGGFLGWLTNTVGSAIAGAVVGAVIVAVVHLLPKRAAGAAHA